MKDEQTRKPRTATSEETKESVYQKSRLRKKGSGIKTAHLGKQPN